MPKGDREILKADPDDGTTPVANLLLEALAIAKLTGKEKGAVLWLWRRTYGWVVEGERLKEREISLDTWRRVLQTDEAKASKILSGLVSKNILLRNYLGPGKSYLYSMNTRVAEWDKGCLIQQGLSEIAKQGLSYTARVVLSKTTTPSDTNLASPKERLKKVLKKEERSSKKETFAEYTSSLREEFNDIDFNLQLRKFNLYWSEGNRKLKNPKLALLNWMTKAREFKGNPRNSLKGVEIEQ